VENSFLLLRVILLQKNGMMAGAGRDDGGGRPAGPASSASSQAASQARRPYSSIPVDPGSFTSNYFLILITDNTRATYSVPTSLRSDAAAKIHAKILRVVYA